jgi:hypothetical protein
MDEILLEIFSSADYSRPHCPKKEDLFTIKREGGTKG